MDTSRRAVESYWRSRMIDAATSDEDKVAPVYKLEEICELLRTSSSGIVKEVSEFVLKRLDHESPVVKQKALRLIKYSVGKAGPEFRREMQRHSVAVKQLLHYKGQPHPLKGDALNKAVRETSQEALSAIFSTEDSKPAAVTEVTHRRMEGFGNTNYVMPPEEKSFLSEVVGIGSASIKKGLTTLAQAHSQSFKKNDMGSGTYRGPTLQRSLTNELDQDRYQKMDYHGGQGSSGVSRSVMSGSWGQNSGVSNAEVINGDSTTSHTASKTREERFLETIVTSGGVRLQPTRDALEAFLVEASKMDALALTHALESKLQSPHWQVRMRAVCVLEAILRKKDDEQFATIMASYFSEHIDIVIRCSESPQGSLREKANRVLSLLGGVQSGNVSEKPIKVQKNVVEMPDLIDTGDRDLLGGYNPMASQNEHAVENPISSTPLIDDIFCVGSTSDILSTSEHRTDEDPFADVSFHIDEDKDKEVGADLFAGMTVGENNNAASAHMPTSGASDPFDIFCSSDPLQTKENQGNDVSNLLSGLSINGNGSTINQNGSSPMVLPQSIHLDSTSKPGSRGLNDSLRSELDSQNASGNTNPMFPMGGVPYGMPPGMMYNQFYPGQLANHGAMGGLLTQQQLMAAMANLQSLSTFNAQNVLAGNAGGPLGNSAIPDIFNTNLQTQTPTVSMNSSKEETKAFDFISDHLASAQNPKRVS